MKSSFFKCIISIQSMSSRLKFMNNLWILNGWFIFTMVSDICYIFSVSFNISQYISVYDLAQYSGAYWTHILHFHMQGKGTSRHFQCQQTNQCRRAQTLLWIPSDLSLFPLVYQILLPKAEWILTHLSVREDVAESDSRFSEFILG